MNLKNLREAMSNLVCFEMDLPNELGERIDCKYHNPAIIKEIENLRKYNVIDRKTVKLGRRDIANVRGGKRLPRGHTFLNADFDNIPYIRATDIVDGKVDIEKAQKINYEIHKK